jgi:catechol O-methyltransferase
MAGGSHYYTLESNPEYAAVLMALVDLAGLKSFVTVLVGDASQSLHRLHSNGAFPSIDFLFLDHDKEAYLNDLKLCEGLGFLHKTSIIAANGVKDSKGEPYDDYVKGTVESKWDTLRFKRWQKDWYEGKDVKPVDVVNKPLNPFERLERGRGTSAERSYREGNPNLLYDSKVVKSYGPTGILVSEPLWH